MVLGDQPMSADKSPPVFGPASGALSRGGGGAGLPHHVADIPATGRVADQFARPLRDLRISVTDRCNYRCRYCMPKEIFGPRFQFMPRSELLSFEEITRLARLFAEAGVQKIRLTGGEPLLRAGLADLVAMLADIPGIDDIALTTNGSRLAKHADELARAGLTRVTVSLDSLDDESFRAVTDSRDSVAHILDAIDAASKAGLKPVKVNTVVRGGANEDQIVALAAHFRGTGHVLRFIEYMDVGCTNDWEMAHVVTASEIVGKIHARFPVEPIGRSYSGEVAERYRYQDGAGEIGVISSVSQPFCGACQRARLSSNGTLYTCLFASSGHDLRRSLRSGASDDELRAELSGIWSARTDRYSEDRGAHVHLKTLSRIEMSYIGG